MSEVKLRLGFEALRSIDSAIFDSTYQNLGSALGEQIRIFKITNNSTVDVTVSYDGGTTDHEYVPASSFVLIDVCANNVESAKLIVPEGTQVAVKGSAGTGSVYLSAYYAR